jgi:hypothetical protein
MLVLSMTPTRKSLESLDMEDWISSYWRQFAAAIAFVVWLVRLEAKAVTNEKEIKRIWQQRKEDMDAAKEARQQTNIMLQEIRDDIKDLIRQTAK